MWLMNEISALLLFWSSASKSVEHHPLRSIFTFLYCVACSGVNTPKPLVQDPVISSDYIPADLTTFSFNRLLYLVLIRVNTQLQANSYVINVKVYTRCFMSMLWVFTGNNIGSQISFPVGVTLVLWAWIQNINPGFVFCLLLLLPQIRSLASSCPSDLQRGNVFAWPDFLHGITGRVKTSPKSMFCAGEQISLFFNWAIFIFWYGLKIQ